MNVPSARKVGRKTSPQSSANGVIENGTFPCTSIAIAEARRHASAITSQTIASATSFPPRRAAVRTGSASWMALSRVARSRSMLSTP